MRLIDADALMENIHRIIWYSKNKQGELVEGATSEMDSYLPTKEVWDTIETSSTIDPMAIRSGRWIQNGIVDGICSDYWHTCSVCGYEHSDEQGSPTPYCPECGAKMDDVADKMKQEAVSIIRCGKCDWYNDEFNFCCKHCARVDRLFFCADGKKGKQRMEGRNI